MYSYLLGGGVRQTHLNYLPASLALRVLLSCSHVFFSEHFKMTDINHTYVANTSLNIVIIKIDIANLFRDLLT